MIRKEDVRATEKDKVVLGASFVPGDVVRACVVSVLVRFVVGVQGWVEKTGVRGTSLRGGAGCVCGVGEDQADP